MLRTADWKYVFTTGKADLGLGYATGNPPPGITHALYDLKRDPEETRNLAKDPKHKAKLQELQQALLRRFKETHPLAKELPSGASSRRSAGLVLRTARCQSEFGRLQILKDPPKLTPFGIWCRCSSSCDLCSQRPDSQLIIPAKERHPNVNPGGHLQIGLLIPRMRRGGLRRSRARESRGSKMDDPCKLDINATAPRQSYPPE